MSAMTVYEAALRHGSGTLVNQHGHAQTLPIALWSGEAGTADNALLDRCTGPTLDVGCGPGRMTAALTARGVPALGIDISALAVRMTTDRGGLALQRSIFHELPGAGRWQHVLLADGNVGIDGDPVHLLRRCRELLTAGGTILLDVGEPGSGLLVEKVRLEQAGRTSDWFRWCWVGTDVLAELALRAGLVVQQVWAVDGRWQGQLGISTASQDPT
ncbi:SAM-dependent methyltransferase [Nakamurella sp. UYEF19]|uniref:class I SAM-dependent methyltransferase n=1 Tax=Nakamurella sp. UYEF19 TaxID=1756392 RepID=UPI003395EFBE